MVNRATGQGTPDCAVIHRARTTPCCPSVAYSWLLKRQVIRAPRAGLRKLCPRAIGINVSHDWHFYGMCTLAAVMSAAAVVALDEHGVIRIATITDVRTTISTPSPVPDIAQKRQDRLPSAVTQPEPQNDKPFETVTLRELPPETPPAATDAQVSEWQTEASAESENPDWLVDVQQEVQPVAQRNAPPPAPTLTGPRVAPAPPATRLPWQSPPPKSPVVQTARLTQRLAEISPAAKPRLTAKFESAKAVWPPSDIALVAFKDEKILELFARSHDGAWKSVHRYPVLAASGKTGPKLRKGDYQVPEGVYGISFLNPDSRYHVSLRVNYPNTFDRQMAEKDGRKELGGDIMIHGKNVSSGCLAVGDAAAEELFVLAASIGVSNIKVVIAPTDLRRNAAPGVEPGQPQWLPKLYSEVQTALAEYPKPPSSGLLSFFGK